MTSGQLDAEAAAVRKLYKFSFIARLVLGLGGWFATAVLEFPIMEDALHYSYQAAQAADYWLAGQQSPWLAEAMENGRQAYGIVILLGVFYCITGGIEVAPLAIIAYCSITAMASPLAYRVGREFGASHRGAMICARLVAFSPAFLIWSSALYKEGLIVIAILLTMEHGLRLQRGFHPFSVAYLGLALIMLSALRFYMAAIFTVALLVSLSIGSTRKKDAASLPPILRQVLILGILFIVFGALGMTGRVEQIMSIDIEENLHQVQRSRQDMATNRSGYRQEVDVSTVSGALAFLPEGLAYFLLVPLPWHLGSMRQNLTIPETMYWTLFIYPRILRGIWYGLRRNPQGVIFLLVTSVSICLFYAIFIGNIGTAYRMRIQVWLLWAPLAGLGWYPIRPNEDIQQHPIEQWHSGEYSVEHIRNEVA